MELIFISGGARSGKSSFAEKYAATIAEENQYKLYYIATSKRTDEEMAERIKLHQLDRDRSGVNWQTIECSVSEEIRQSVGNMQPNSVVLMDCLTVLLTNEFFKDSYDEDSWQDERFQKNVQQSILVAIPTLLRRVNVLIIVSNEILQEPVFGNNTLVDTYRKLIGTIHQHIVAKASAAFLVEAGVPVLMKD